MHLILKVNFFFLAPHVLASQLQKHRLLDNKKRLHYSSAVYAIASFFKFLFTKTFKHTGWKLALPSIYSLQFLSIKPIRFLLFIGLANPAIILWELTLLCGLPGSDSA